MKEIERKFLVKDDTFKQFAISKEFIAQGYLNSDPQRIVRVRIKGEKGYLTIKGPTHGITRFEWEKEISFEEATQLLQLSESSNIEKTRWFVPYNDHIFEVDEFHGDNAPLIIAELELTHENESYEAPNWIGDEVSHLKQYNNAFISKTPFKEWNQDLK